MVQHEGPVPTDLFTDLLGESCDVAFGMFYPMAGVYICSGLFALGFVRLVDNFSMARSADVKNRDVALPLKENA